MSMLIPKLTSKLHKGQMGRIGVLGGSKDYTGAPYYAAMAALRTGADLVYIYTPSKEAANVIKTYSPDIIVTHLNEGMGDADVTMAQYFDRLHALVVGPGLGSSESWQLTSVLILWLQLKRPLIVDADAIQHFSRIVSEYGLPVGPHVILTPNKVEFGRLCKEKGISVDYEESLSKLARSLGGVTVCHKGETDRISDGINNAECSVQGGLRRCGGQGDILAGIISVYAHWATMKRDENNSDEKISMVQAVKEACAVVRQLSLDTFEHRGRSMVTSDILEQMSSP